jgi:Helix-turn-helix domain
MSQSKHCDVGLPLGGWPSSGPPVVNDSILQQISPESLEKTNCNNSNPYKRPRSAMPESAPSTSEEILNDRSPICNDFSRNTRSLATLAQDSTGSDGDLRPFWNAYTREESLKWWLPEKTDCVALDWSSWSGSLKRTGRGSWFSVQTSIPAAVRSENSLKTCSPSSLSLWRDIMECVRPSIVKEDTRPSKKIKVPKKSLAAKVRRVRLFPTKEERQTLRKWIGTARWTYNRCLVAVEKEGVKRNKKELRAHCLNADVFESDTENKWVLETLYDVRDEAMNDLLKAYGSNFAAGRKKFTIKFRSKKDRQQSIVMLSKHWGKSYGKFAFLAKIKAAEPLPTKLDHDSRIVMNNLGEFYICIPKPLEVRTESQGPVFSEVSNNGKKFSSIISVAIIYIIYK